MGKEHTNSLDKEAVAKIREEIITITSLVNSFEEDGSYKLTKTLLSEIKFYAGNIEKVAIDECMMEITALSGDIINKLDTILKNHDSKYIVIEISNYINNVDIFLRRMSEEFIPDSTNEVFEVSDEMKSLFLEESLEHFVEINKILINLETGKFNYKKLLDEFYREIHSIKGDTNALGYYKATKLAHTIETEVSVLQKSNQKPDQDFIDYLFESIDTLSKLINKIRSGEYDKEIELSNDFSDTNFISEENIYDEIPDDIKKIYISETSEHLTNINTNLMSIEYQGSDNQSDFLEEIYRELHSIKGDSNALGYDVIGELSHEVESFISKIQNKEINLNQNNLDILFQKMSVLQKKFSDITNHVLDFSPIAISETNKNIQLPDLEENVIINNDQDDFFDEDNEIPDEIKDLYGEETKEHVGNISKMLIELENDPDSKQELLESIYRELHSIKGDSNALGLTRVGQTAHEMETIIASIQNNQIDISDSAIDELINKLEVIIKKVSEVTGVFIDHVKDSNDSRENTSNLNQENNIQTINTDNSLTISDENNDIPDEIKEIYISETSEHLLKLNKILLDLENNDNDLDNYLEEIYRELHSIKGDSNTLGYEHIGKVSHDIESIVTKIQKKETKYDKNTLDLLFEKFKMLENIFSNSTGYKFTKDFEDKEDYYIYQEAPENNDESEDNVDIPDEIKDLYAEEAKEHLNSLSKNILELENDPSNQEELLQNIYRELHSIKGDSNALGLTKIGDAAHKMESIVNSIQQKESQLSSKVIESLFTSLEIIRIGIIKTTGININSGKVSAEPDTVNQEKSETTNIQDEEPEESYEDIPDDIKEIYISETQEHLNKLSQIVLAIEEENEPELFNDLYRELHSIKGDSNALGFIKVGELSHNLETVITNCQKNGSANKADIEKLHAGLEKINNIFDKITGKNKNKKILRTTIHNNDIKKTVVIAKKSNLFSKNAEITQTNDTKKILADSLKVTSEKSKTTGDNKKTGDYKKSSGRQDDETIRVSTNKIDKIINLSDELLISKIGYDQRLSEIKDVMETIGDYKNTLKHVFKSLVNQNNNDEIFKTFEELQNNLSFFEEKLTTNFKEFKKDNYRFSLLVDEMQLDSRNTRMLTASYLIEPLKIVVRNTAKKLNKLVTLHVLGEGIEIDRLIIEKLKDPLGHIIRNSLDHGIENPEERKIKRKNEQAKLIIDIKISGNNIVFKISDDGRGINYPKIASKAVRLGMISEKYSETISDFELNKIMFSPGFSTADQITDVSGRGVGLDVVKSTIEGINGNISVISVMGEGTSFILSVPLTLTTFDALLILLGDNKYALPKQSVVSTMNIHISEMIINGDNKAVLIEGKPIKIVNLSLLLGEISKSEGKQDITLAVIESGEGKIAFIVDDFIESRKMVMKNLGNQLLKVPNISGATIMGDGEPVLVLNTAELVSSVYSESINFNISNLTDVDKENKRDKIRILVVDDSITTRTLEKNILENAGFEVVIGKNGLEGKEGVEKYLPDLIITDVEMPKMNGYQFASWVKKESSYSSIPVIMITSLATPEFRMKGVEAGVDAYIVKGEFNQTKLLETINQLLYRA